MNNGSFEKHNVVASIGNAIMGFQGYTSDVLEIEPVLELRAQLEYLGWVFEQTDPTIVTKLELDALNPAMQNITSHLSQLLSQPTHYSNAALLQCGIILQKFPYPRIRKIPRSEANRIIEGIQQNADQAIGILTAKVVELENEIIRLTNELGLNITNISGSQSDIDSLQSELSGLTSTLTALYSETNSKIETALAAKLAEGASRLNKIIDESQAEISRVKSVAAETITNANRDLEDLRESEGQKFLSSLTHHEHQAGEILAKIQNLYGIAGGDSSSGSLTVSATSEKYAYWILFGLSLCAFVFGACTVFKVISPVINDKLTLEALVARLSITVALFLPAWFLSSAASRHRKSELAFRSLALRVAAFDPYLNEFSAEERVSMKKAMADTFFATDLQAEYKSKSLFSDLRDIDKLITPLEKVFDKIKSVATRTE